MSGSCRKSKLSEESCCRSFSDAYKVAFRAGVDQTATNMWTVSDSISGDSRLRENSHITPKFELLNVFNDGLVNI